MSMLNPLAPAFRQGGRWWKRLRSSLLAGRAAPAFDAPAFDAPAFDAPAFDAWAALARMQRQPLAPTIVVPVYDAPAELDGCMAALLANSPLECRIVVIDDCSPDPRIAEIVARYRDDPKVEVHRNRRNLGYTRSVNRGIEIAARADVVLLNSDTEVTPRWLENLRLAAYCGERVATVTPFSNNAGAFSAPAPDKDNPLPHWLGLDDYARLVTQASARLHPPVPTGNGFCMYMRRDCIDEIGIFDAEAFPRGYGEENDFCMRAARRGWTHVIDDATLIRHVRSASFGEAKAGLMREGRAVLDERYPDYTGLVRDFSRNRRLRQARERIAAALAASKAPGGAVPPRTLIVLPAGEDGDHEMPRQMPDRGEGRAAFFLRCDPARLELSQMRHGDPAERVVLRHAEGSGASDAAPAAIANWLVAHAIETVEIRDGAFEAASLRGLCGRLNIPTVHACEIGPRRLRTV